MEYEIIKQLKQSEKSIVQLVREKDGEQIFIRKILRGYQPIYLLLQICEHPGLTKLYDVVMSDDTTTIIEEYIEGEPLGNSELSKQQFLNIVRELCSVLEYLHGKGIIHRDIKPSNIILSEDGHIRLIDFDAARMPKADHKQDTRLLGTRGYAPPEQYGFEQTDVRTDIYALGITLNRILGDNIRKTRYQGIIRKCTKLDPDRRYQSVREVKKAFFRRERYVLYVGVLFLFLIFLVRFVLNAEIEPKSAFFPETGNDVQEHIMESEAETVEMLSKTENETQSNVGESEIAEEASHPESEIVSEKSALERYPNQILWNNIPIEDMMGRYVDDVIEEMGTLLGILLEEHTAKDEKDSNWYSYYNIVICFDEQRKVNKIGMAPYVCTYNGISLEVNAEKLVGIFGKATFSGQNKVTGKYYLDYYNNGKKRGFTFYMNSYEEAADELWID